MDNVAITVIAWIVVFPLMLAIALLVWRAAYRRYKRLQDAREEAEAMERIEEQRRKIRESWKT